MMYVGNYKSWIDPEIISIIKNTKGERRPNPVVSEKEMPTHTKWTSAGIDVSKIGWEFSYNEHIGRPHIALPISPNGRKYNWWFSKLNPGDILPLHVDLFPESKQKVQRFWMACQDHEPGHIFYNDNETLNNYKAGDLFEFPAADSWHGAANLGFTPKISLQILFYD